MLTILDLLADKGALVDYSDPHLPTITASHGHKLSLKSVPITAETLSHYDCVVIGTNHDRFDFDLIKKASRLIIDTRGTYTELDDKIFRA